jgi:hypothetical protein
VIERYNFYQEIINDPSKVLKGLMMNEIKSNFQEVHKLAIRQKTIKAALQTSMSPEKQQTTMTINATIEKTDEED